MDSKNLDKTLQFIRAAIAKAQKNLEYARSSEPFKIVVCGTFSTGKTSLLNALLGCDLPTGLRPITKVVTRICYGPRHRVFLENTATNQKREIDAKSAEKVILNEQKNKEFRNCRICCEIPSSFLKLGVEFLDTPGLEDDSSEKLDEISRNAVQESDFCIVTFACNTFGDMHERAFLDELQTISNGNFVCVLNCLNRVNSEEQMNDLRSQAKVLLRDCGNERVGIGRYFMVDSDKYSAEKYLDGLENWLRDLVTKNAASIRKDAAVSRGLSALTPAIEDGDRLIHELFQEAEQQMVAYDKSMVAQCHCMSVSRGATPQILNLIKKEFHRKLEQTLCAELRKRLEKIPAEKYNDKVSDIIGNLILEFSNELEAKLKDAFIKCSVPDPWDYIKKTSYRWTKRTIWTTKKNLVDYMSDGLSYDSWDWNVYHTNAYVQETIKDTETETIPNIKRNVNAYFDMMEKKLVSQNCVNLLLKESPEQKEYQNQANSLAEQLMDAWLMKSELLEIAQS